ncbi:hypothetical protein JOC36_001468 [Weissella uvarum]|uniref:hypothetical protein n=1 Tax=Weissella uvarum TaxID=1479233 RepID=UPI0019618892|nr:hypothetical protein [Weissella uvarum]MBM7617875.1 hypothetical protein [Weissella uvarum]MCM0596127.1 hypothetical protein [Weissella uvarum]
MLNPLQDISDVTNLDEVSMLDVHQANLSAKNGIDNLCLSLVIYRLEQLKSDKRFILNRGDIDIFIDTFKMNQSYVGPAFKITKKDFTELVNEDLKQVYGVFSIGIRNWLTNALISAIYK